MRRIPAGRDFDGWVAQLGVPSWRQRAKQHLLAAGAPALPALRRGTRHPDPLVRRMCVGILDHLVDEASVPDLVAALDDGDPHVCARALHALACDTCKKNECRPGEALFVPRAIEFLEHHPNPDVRAAAIDALGKVAGHRPDVAAALEVCGATDPDPRLRSMARRRVRRITAAAIAVAGS